MNATKIPCTVTERETLVQAEKTIMITDCSSIDFYEAVQAEFTKLQGCGGFEFMRCISNTNDLEPINMGIAHSPKILKSVLVNGRIFRPC